MSLVYFSNWQYLPDLTIVKIYKYLDDNDKVKMSLTCKRWYSLFKSACLWRTRHFNMCGYSLDEASIKANKFAEQHGAHVRYLTISCRHRPYLTNEKFLRSVEHLLSSRLRHSCLSDFQMRFLQFDRYRVPAPSMDRFINHFVKFFKHQNHLNVFDMTSSQFCSRDGIRLLDTIGTKCGSIIEELFIEDFFSPRAALFQIEKFKRVMTRFSNLSYLAINYNCLSDSVLEVLATNLAGLFRTIKIKVSKNDPHAHRISGQTWKQMVTCCPALSVTFWFDSVGHWSEMMPILEREIPVTDIHLWTEREDDTDSWELSRTINHIADCYRNSLESLSLRLNNSHEDVDGAIMRLVSKCMKLKDLSINGQMSVATIESLLQLEERDEIHLDTLNITACGLTHDEWAVALLLNESYANLVTERGLNFEITTDFIPLQHLQLGVSMMQDWGDDAYFQFFDLIFGA